MEKAFSEVEKLNIMCEMVAACVWKFDILFYSVDFVSGTVYINRQMEETLMRLNFFSKKIERNCCSLCLKTVGFFLLLS